MGQWIAKVLLVVAGILILPILFLYWVARTVTDDNDQDENLWR